MKKFFLILLLLMPVFVASAQRQEISLVDVRNNSTPHNTCVPNVSSEGGDITIKSDTLLTDVTVVVKDQYGSILHASSETIDNMGTTISVPAGGFSEPSSIDLYYDDRHLRGDIVQ